VERCFRQLKGPPLRIAGAAVPMPYASELQSLGIPSAEQAFRAILASIQGG
jgi:pyruvate dehydrogenase E1 component beta subunit